VRNHGVKRPVELVVLDVLYSRQEVDGCIASPSPQCVNCCLRTIKGGHLEPAFCERDGVATITASQIKDASAARKSAHEVDNLFGRRAEYACFTGLAVGSFPEWLSHERKPGMLFVNDAIDALKRCRQLGRSSRIRI
jgi:hypothetical protein